MKKLAIALVAVATLGLAACNGSNDEAANNAADLNVTENQTDVDVNVAAGDAANGAIDDIANTGSDVGNAVENTVSDAGNAVDNATDKN
jgi:hypothetical protein